MNITNGRPEDVARTAEIEAAKKDSTQPQMGFVEALNLAFNNISVERPGWIFVLRRDPKTDCVIAWMGCHRCEYCMTQEDVNATDWRIAK